MVLLPIVYFLIAVAVGSLVVWWARYGLVVFENNHSIFAALAYVGPICAGVILVFFLFKPLFAKRVSPPPPVEVDLATEPALRIFLEEICRRVGVALPTAVHLDGVGNASASFRRGWRSLGQRDLVLTLGTPFIRNLTIQQLGGIIAHEFGHFAQRGGMFSYFVVVSINRWFGAVVYGRDHWDDWLVRQSQTLDWRLAIPLLIARGGVWLGRRVLQGLMHAAHALSCWLSRQMEFDADYYAVQVQGAESFAATARATQLLMLAESRAGADINAWWRDRKVVPDFAEHVAYRLGRLEPEAGAEIDRGLSEEKTRWYHTHPSMRERIERARLLAAPAALKSDEPANRLFVDFAARSRAVTSVFYQQAVGDAAKLAETMSADQINASASRMDAEFASLQRLTAQVVSVDRPINLAAEDLMPGSSAPRLGATEHARWLENHASELRSASAEANEALNRRLELLGVRRFVNGGVAITPGSFRLKASNPAAVQAAIEDAEAIIAKHGSLLLEATARIRARLVDLAQLAHTHSEHTASAPLLARLRTFAQLSDCFARLPKLLALHAEVQLFEANASGLRGNDAFSLLYGALRNEAREAFDACIKSTESVLLPSDSSPGLPPQDVASWIRIVTPKTDIATETNGRLGSIIELHFRLLREIAAEGERLESGIR